MSREKISRKEFFSIAAGGLVISVLTFTGCGVIGRAVVIKIAPKLLKVGDILLRAADGILTIQGFLELGSQVFEHQVSNSDAYSLKNGASLIIEDGSGKQFISAFGVYDDIGVVQLCNPSGALVLRTQPSNNARVIRQLEEEERLGVFDLRHQGGWYHVKTLGGEAGWVHGNCLKRLPRKNV